MDLFDQRDGREQMQPIFSQEGLPINHDILLARNVLNQLPEFPALVVLSNEIWTILDKMFVLIHMQLHALSAIQQTRRCAIIFQHVLASYQHVLEKST